MNFPAVSIVLNTYNRLPLLIEALESVSRLSYPEYEVIIVDDASTDKTEEFLAKLDNSKYKVVRHQTNQGLAEARNTGIRNAKYDLVAFLDDDCLPAVDWLKNLVTKLLDSGADVVYGQTVYVKDDYLGYFPERLVSNSLGKWPAGGNILFKKNVFVKVGSYKTEYYLFNNEDSEMAVRAVGEGFKFVSAPEAKVYHQYVLWTVKSLWNSAKNAAVWVRLKKEYPKTYNYFGSPVKWGRVIYPFDYLVIFFWPIIVPVVWLRYLFNGHTALGIFFAKWPVYFYLRRYYIYKEAVKNRVFIL